MLLDDDSLSSFLPTRPGTFASWDSLQFMFLGATGSSPVVHADHPFPKTGKTEK
jgi:hypothetical protein